VIKNKSKKKSAASAADSVEDSEPKRRGGLVHRNQELNLIIDKSQEGPFPSALMLTAQYLQESHCIPGTDMKPFWELIYATAAEPAVNTESQIHNNEEKKALETVQNTIGGIHEDAGQTADPTEGTEPISHKTEGPVIYLDQTYVSDIPDSPDSPGNPMAAATVSTNAGVNLRLDTNMEMQGEYPSSEHSATSSRSGSVYSPSDYIPEWYKSHRAQARLILSRRSTSPDLRTNNPLTGFQRRHSPFVKEEQKRVMNTRTAEEDIENLMTWLAVSAAYQGQDQEEAEESWE
jgi:hypothetical protein